MSTFRQLLAAAVLIVACALSQNDETVRPNILFIMLDDLGYGDISATSGQFPTPHMDSLYNNGVRLDRHYIHLMCSPSRTQFLTGRYAMNLGFGEFSPWDSQEIGGIPIGQPTIANWLSQFGEYTTYGVGKWHLGYANEQLAPEANGFDHWYGFYQGSIDYETKMYDDIENGDTGMYDMWSDGEEDYSIVTDGSRADELSMNLFGAKIQEYLDVEGQKMQDAESSGEKYSPFYLFASLQSMHGIGEQSALPTIAEYEDECDNRMQQALGVKALSDDMKTRSRYCQMTLLTDNMIGEMIGTLRSSGLYENTLIVFTTDNGGHTKTGASNYPYRGSKGDLYEGNVRVLTSITGGFLEKAGVVDHTRFEMVSNLDWTPTLLHFAGYLDSISTDDYTWDGIDQYDMIMGTDNYNAETDARQSLVMLLGNTELTSARINVEHEGHSYKYTLSDNSSFADTWLYMDTLAYVWTVPDYDDSFEGMPARIEIAYDGSEDNPDYKYSLSYEGGYLFDLTNDVSEKYNLLNPEYPGYDAKLNEVVIAKAKALLDEFVQKDQEDPFFCESISTLHLRQTEGDPSLIGDGEFVRPWLDNDAYQEAVEKMFEYDITDVPQNVKDLYLNAWTVPDAVTQDQAVLFNEGMATGLHQGHRLTTWNSTVLLAMVVAAICASLLYYFVWRNGSTEKKLLSTEKAPLLRSDM